MRFVWLAGWVGVAVWSLVAAIGYFALDGVGALMMRHADLFSTDPEIVEWIWTLTSWFRSVSTSAVLVVWGLVSLAILGVPWLLGRALGRQGAVAGAVWTARSGAGRHGTPPGRDAGGSVIDLAPGDYAVRDGRRASGVPRVGPGPTG